MTYRLKALCRACTALVLALQLLSPAPVHALAAIELYGSSLRQCEALHTYSSDLLPSYPDYDTLRRAMEQTGRYCSNAVWQQLQLMLATHGLTNHSIDALVLGALDRACTILAEHLTLRLTYDPDGYWDNLASVLDAYEHCAYANRSWQRMWPT